jgi:hypothetical protein
VSDRAASMTAAKRRLNTEKHERVTAAERPRYRERWSSATSGSERQVPHGRSGTNARGISGARSPLPPGSLALPDQTTGLRTETGLR